MKKRGPFQGMLAIARFNWPFYLGAVFAIFIAAAVAAFLVSPVIRMVCALVAAGAAYFIVVSLGVSWWVYDRSDLYRWNWLRKSLGEVSGKRLVACHSGFDEVSAPLKEELPGNDWILLDHFDEERMTEPSIHRARAFWPPAPGTLPCPFDRWPVDDGSCDVIFGLLAIHELRSEDERAAWFSEARRCLKSGGRIVLGEHVRDLANFIAFGPGFLHFHSPASWRRCWTRAGLREAATFSITPFVRIFLLE